MTSACVCYVSLQADARISLAELSRRLGLSSPAVADRLRRLESGGIIRGYLGSDRPAPSRLFVNRDHWSPSFPRAAARVAELAQQTLETSRSAFESPVMTATSPLLICATSIIARRPTDGSVCGKKLGSLSLVRLGDASPLTFDRHRAAARPPPPRRGLERRAQSAPELPRSGGWHRLGGARGRI